MARIESSSLPNGLPLHRVELPTRSTTVLVAFDAGARTERPEENGMAHFLEHLVFKGGQKYDDYRKVNQTAETMGAVLNAYTSHDLVAFHITCRAEVAAEAIDLLTDFVGRPKIDAEELDRERGVVIQEIARAHDQPSVIAEHLIDRAAFGDHPLGPARAGPGGAPARRSRATAILAFRRRQWVGRARRRVPGRQPRPPARELRDGRAVRPLPVDLGQRRRPSRRRRSRRTTLVEARESNAVAPADVLPPVDRPARAAPSAPRWPSTRRCWAARWARACSTRSASSAAWPTRVYAIDHSFADVPILQLSAGLDSAKCVEAFTRMREIVDELRTDGPSEEEVERARAYAAGRRVLAFENTNAVARHAAAQTVVFGQDIDPDKAIEALDAVTYDQVVEVARGISEALLGRLRRPARHRTSSHKRTLAAVALRRPQWVLGDTSRSSTTASSSATCAGSRTGGRSTARCSAARAWLTCAAPARSASAGPST